MDIGRVFAVVLIGGSQFKVTAEDLIQFVGHVEADVGERIRLEKVLLVGGDNFSVIGKPLLSSDMVRIEATVVEKTLSEKKILFRFKRRMNYKRYKGDEVL
ncbi:putative 39S ribosomal protein L21, mitochondrial isoform X3 [Apostichopus japonicus]|uniref:Large ribosomal subunit protein bL21m n=1 Tax=Stichopus japonicus TaxID=307972 RepID=A0A2G8L9H1_STIJA|nr:putative 39S ribosomal protein L21, mitochondrial isoform X3 [Apostichopus japonicus]